MQDKINILIVDDENHMLQAMETVLARLGHSILKCSNGEQALKMLSSSTVDLVISDMKMPNMGGAELLVKIKTIYPRLPVVMITAYGTIQQAVEAMKNGAFDFITKPFSAEDLEGVVKRVFRKPDQKLVNRKIANDEKAVAILTNDSKFKNLLEIATTISLSDATVLIQGESGTGKELIARLIHNASSRSNGPFVAVNCAALPGNLLESELFGHEKGAFTGAVEKKQGKFELANGGTILLDEISEMEDVLQAKLLRVLQEREVDRVGGQKPVPINVRIIATTNRDIRKTVSDGKFREDLYYRLNVIPLYTPPLREREGDIRLLIEHFVRKYSFGKSISLSDELISKLENYDWPGNVRELQNACERAVLLATDGKLSQEHFMLGAVKLSNPMNTEGDELSIVPGLSVAEAEKRLIFETLRATANNRTKAAELLGISIRTLRNKLHEYAAEGDTLSEV
jgi:DNA-binding NtrC family response regulator